MEAECVTGDCYLSILVSFDLCFLKKHLENSALGSMPLGGPAEFDVKRSSIKWAVLTFPAHCERHTLHTLSQHLSSSIRL